MLRPSRVWRTGGDSEDAARALRPYYRHGRQFPCQVCDSSCSAVLDAYSTGTGRHCGLEVGCDTNCLGAGQTCIRSDYLLVDECVGDSCVKLLERELKEQYGGENVKDSDSYSRNERMNDRLVYLGDGRKYVAYGGDTEAVQCFILPTLLNFRINFDFRIDDVLGYGRDREHAGGALGSSPL
ncbi:hypothetical protein V7S43_013855 [Phytophthora oleae]|uniref:Uncharacterized protein n=1 Tax=Phytophthora oleae TaxID=2107226 RepID=A0ABD3F4D0_9STRA